MQRKGPGARTGGESVTGQGEFIDHHFGRVDGSQNAFERCCISVGRVRLEPDRFELASIECASHERRGHVQFQAFGLALQGLDRFSKGAVPDLKPSCPGKQPEHVCRVGIGDHMIELDGQHPPATDLLRPEVAG